MLEQSKAAGYEYSFNSFLYTGQWYDFEFDQYYLRARMFDPYMGRFTTRDPEFGDSKLPLTLHAYLYCLNNPINRVDPAGELSALAIAGGVLGGAAVHGAAIWVTAEGVYGDPALMDLGLFMERLVPLGILMGTAMGTGGPAAVALMGRGLSATGSAAFRLTKAVVRYGTSPKGSRQLYSFLDGLTSDTPSPGDRDNAAWLAGWGMRQFSNLIR